jgi:hypothetical protein
LSGHGHETVVDVFRGEKVKKEYKKRATILSVSLFVCAGILLVIPIETTDSIPFDDAKIVIEIKTDEEIESDVEPERLRDSPIRMLRLFVFAVFAISGILVFTKPTLFRIGEYEYQKTVLSNKSEYDSLKKALHGKEDWKDR